MHIRSDSMFSSIRRREAARVVAQLESDLDDLVAFGIICMTSREEPGRVEALDALHQRGLLDKTATSVPGGACFITYSVKE